MAIKLKFIVNIFSDICQQNLLPKVVSFVDFTLLFFDLFYCGEKNECLLSGDYYKSKTPSQGEREREGENMATSKKVKGLNKLTAVRRAIIFFHSR